jgi:hypothetical protein
VLAPIVAGRTIPLSGIVEHLVVTDYLDVRPMLLKEAEHAPPIWGRPHRHPSKRFLRRRIQLTDDVSEKSVESVAATARPFLVFARPAWRSSMYSCI